MDGEPFPGNVEEIGNSNTSDIGVMMGGQYQFARHGESGMWMADVLPHTAKMADDICLINSMWTDHPNHDNALYKIHSGRLFMGYPTLRRLDGLWAGNRKPEPARLCRPQRSARPAQERHAELDVRLLAAALSGHAVSADRFADPESQAAVRTAFGSHGIGPRIAQSAR